jgi:hypothetical protein
MRSSRLIQTLIQAGILFLLAGIVFRDPPETTARPAQGSQGGPPAPAHSTLTQTYKAYFQEYPGLRQKADLVLVRVSAVSLQGAAARAKLRIDFQWTDHNPAYTDGPLKNAPGQRGDRVSYTEVFTYRHWDTGWDIEGRVEPPDIR